MDDARRRFEECPEHDLTEKVIGCAIKVHRELGPGFLEIMYERALIHELRKANLTVENQKPVTVYYDGVEIGEHRADILVEDRVLIELKSTDGLHPKHTAQVMSTLKALISELDYC
jgi:GxxExxY protein